MDTIIGKIKDVYLLLQEALASTKKDNVSQGISNSIMELNSRLTTKIDVGHFQKNFKKVIEDLYADSENHEIGIKFSSPYLDGLCNLLYEKTFAEKFGIFNGAFLYNQKSKKVEPYQTKKSNIVESTGSIITDISTKEKVRYSISKFQDTILPIIHKPAILRKYHVIFEEQLNWNQCLDALIAEKIDVALHSFPTALAYMSNPAVTNEIFFWPFFTFHGYAIFINKKKFKLYCKKKGLNVSSFKEMEDNFDKATITAYLTECKIVLERFTDVEWVVKDFLRKHDCDWEYIKENNLLDENINEGKRKFKNDNHGDILCTNSLHVLDLEGRKEKFELVDKGDKLTKHKNFNGLICTMEFYNEKKALVNKIISSWFKCMADTQREWEIIKSNYKEGDINNFIYQSLLNYLQEATYSDKISLDKFIKSYNGNNNFFTTPSFAFEKLFTDMYQSEREKNRNWEIAQIQNKYKDGKGKDEVFDAILKNMNNVKSKIIL